MAEGLSLLNRISARVLTSRAPDSWAAATLVSPLHAVTTGEAIPPEDGTEVVLQSPDWSPREVAAIVVGRDTDRNLVLLRLPGTAAEVPADLLAPVESLIGSGWQSFDNVSGAVTDVVTKNGHEYLRLAPAARYTQFIAGSG